MTHHQLHRNYGGDPDKIFFCAEEAGAQIVLLSVFRSRLSLQTKTVKGNKSKNHDGDSMILPPIYGVIL